MFYAFLAGSLAFLGGYWLGYRHASTKLNEVIAKFTKQGGV